MAKDPAFLFYYQDFLVGTEFMSMEERGIYITMLCHLADKGSLSEKHMLSICKGYAFSDLLKSKFMIDENGNYYNQRLLVEVEKRRKYTESRRFNANKEKAYAKHMENENENINENNLLKRKEGDIYFLAIFNQFLPPELQSKWCEYLDYCYSRNDIRLNRATITAQLKFLREHTTDAKAIMEQSIKNNWKGLFEVKNGTSKKDTGATPDELASIVERRYNRQKAEK